MHYILRYTIKRKQSTFQSERQPYYDKAVLLCTRENIILLQSQRKNSTIRNGNKNKNSTWKIAFRLISCTYLLG